MLGQIIDDALSDFQNGSKKEDNPHPVGSPENLLWEITYESSTQEKEILKALSGNPLFEKSSKAEKDFIQQKLNQIQQDLSM